MHFVVIGCGAVGGYFGGRLLENNQQVTFVARNTQLSAIKSHGIEIQSIEGDANLENVSVIDAQTITDDSLTSKADVILVAVKSYHLVNVLNQIKPLISENTKVVPLLNGVNAVNVLLEHGICSKNIYGGLAKIICEKRSDGVIYHSGGKPHITLGNPFIDNLTGQDKADDIKNISAIAKCLKLAGISVGVSSDIELALWRKFILVASWGALAAARKLTLGEIKGQSHLEFMLECIIKEYVEIGRKAGIALTDKHIKETMTFLGRLPASSETSMQRDIAQLQQSEFDVLVAYPMSLAKTLKVSTPVLLQCYNTLTPLLNE